MDWRAVKFDWNRARAFLVTVEEGSLSAAARALGTTQPTLGRQVSALERELGIVLFERVGRAMELTPNGLELASYIRNMGTAATQVSLAAAGKSQSLEGSVSITASEIEATHLLPPLLKKLHAEEPGITVKIVVSNETLNLRRREADIAIRSFKPDQPDLIAEKIKDVPCRLYGAEAYLGTFNQRLPLGIANRPEFIGFENTDRQISALLLMGLNVDIRDFPVVTDSHLVHLHLARGAVGLAILPEDIGDIYSELRRAFPDIAPLIVPMWLVTHREMKTNRRVRRVFKFLADELVHPASPASVSSKLLSLTQIATL